MPAKTSDRGVVLVAALWLIVLLAVIAGGMIELARSERRIARNVVAEAEARALADAGIARGIVLLLDRGQTENWSISGASRSTEHAGKRIEIAIQDEFGRIDLNAAADDLLKGLFRSVGVREVEAEALVDRIADWRDPDDATRLLGAERADYGRAGRSYGPRNGAFESVDELGQVLGVSASLLRSVAPSLTVFSRRGNVDTATAPRETLRVLFGGDEARISQMLAARANTSPVGSGSAPETARGAMASVPDLTGRAFTIVARVEPQRGVSLTRTAVIRFTGDSNRSYWIQDWR